MKGLGVRWPGLLLVLITGFGLMSCSRIPLKEGGLEIAKDTTAGIDDIGVGRVTRQF